jgi:hypothetical protein
MNRLVPKDGRLCVRSVDGSPDCPVALRGFNLSGAAKNPDNRGLPFSPVRFPSIKERAETFLPTLRDDGFDLLRIPLVWEFLAPDRDGGLREEAREAIRELVQYAGTLGFWVILDIHQDVAGSFFRRKSLFRPKKWRSWHGDGFPPWLLRDAYSPEPNETLPPEWRDAIPWFLPFLPLFHSWGLNYEYNGALKRVLEGLGEASVIAAFERFARELAAAFGDLDNVLTYEVFNEPVSTLMKGTYGPLARAVCRGLGGAIHFDGTPTCSPMPAGDWLDGRGLFGFPYLDKTPEGIESRSLLPVGTGLTGRSFWLATPHFYDIAADSPWLCPRPDLYDAVVEAAAQAFGRWGLVPLVGEFGCGSERAHFKKRHAVWIDAFERRGWSWCLWNLNPDASDGGRDIWCGERYSVAQRTEDGGVHLTDTYRDLLRPFPRRYGGAPVATSWKNRRYEATFGKATVPGRRTEIFVPKSLGEFTHGGPCTRRDRLVLVDSDGGDATVTVVID